MLRTISQNLLNYISVKPFLEKIDLVAQGAEGTLGGCKEPKGEKSREGEQEQEKLRDMNRY